MDLGRLHATIDAVPGHVAVAFQRTPTGRHVAICHSVNGGQWALLHLKWDHWLASSDLAGKFVLVALNVDDETARDLAGYCRLIANAHPKIPYSIRHSSEPSFLLDTGQLSHDFQLGHGQTCATFVLVVFEKFGLPLVDLQTWEERLDDLQDHITLVSAMKDHEGFGPRKIDPDHVAAVENSVGCMRVRPEEVAGACLYDEKPVDFERAVPAGVEVLAAYDELTLPAS